MFYQLFEKETSTYTYLLADPYSKEAILVDPVIDVLEHNLQLIRELGVRLKYVLDTHVHADHITASGELRRRTGAKTVIGVGAKVECADLCLVDGQELLFGNEKLTALATPGHTDSCMSFIVGNRVFTGDTLLIRGTGRTDFQQGSATQLYESITQKLFQLPDETEIYPAHDYRGQTHSTIGLEKRFNPRVGGGKTKAAFVEIMQNLKLDHPKRIHEALPANLVCGEKSA